VGFFSQACAAKTICGGKDILAPYNIPDGAEWMNDAVVITPDGDRISGDYDGYGTVDGTEYAIGEGNTVFHKACWELTGRPTVHTPGASGHDETQGFFYDPDYVLPDPRGDRAAA
jgi:hypothetical protein